MKKNNLFSEKALKFSEEELTEKAKKYAWFEAPNNLHYLTVPLVKKGYHAGYKQCKEDLRELIEKRRDGIEKGEIVIIPPGRNGFKDPALNELKWLLALLEKEEK